MSHNAWLEKLDGWEYQHGKLWWGYAGGTVIAEIEKSDLRRWRARVLASGWQNRFRTRKEARAWTDREIKRYARKLVRKLCRR